MTSDVAYPASVKVVKPPTKNGSLWIVGLIGWFYALKVFSHGTLAEPLIPRFWWMFFGEDSAQLLALALLLPTYLARAGVERELGFTGRITWRATVGAALAGTGAALMQHAMMQFLFGVVNGGGNEGISALLNESWPLSGLEKFGVMLSSALTAPVIEELVYRGLLLTALVHAFGDRKSRWPAYAMASGALFAHSHSLSHPAFLVPYAVMGSAFAGVYLYTRSLGVVIVAHGVMNAILFAISWQTGNI